jgi:hypothetical protein
MLDIPISTLLNEMTSRSPAQFEKKKSNCIFLDPFRKVESILYRHMLCGQQGEFYIVDHFFNVSSMQINKARASVK